MGRLLKRLLLVLATLGAGAFLYTLMRAEGERALRRVRRGTEPLPPVEPQAREPDRCTALKADGARCSREAQPGSQHCWQHA